MSRSYVYPRTAGLSTGEAAVEALSAVGTAEASLIQLVLRTGMSVLLTVLAVVGMIYRWPGRLRILVYSAWVLACGRLAGWGGPALPNYLAVAMYVLIVLLLLVGLIILIDLIRARAGVAIDRLAAIVSL